MIIELLLSALFNVFKLLTTPINIPDMPDGIIEVLQIALEYLQIGVGILSNYTLIEFIFGMVGTIVLIDVGIALYHFVMWVIRKIPMAGMS